MAPVDHQIGERFQHRSSEVVDPSEVESEWACIGDLGSKPIRFDRKEVRVHHPLPDRWLEVLAGEAAELLDLHFAALSDHAVDISVGCGSRRRHQGINVEDLATTQGHTLPGLAEDEAVAGYERQVDREMETNCARGSRVDRIGTEHTDPNRMFPRADVGEVGSASGDRSVERVEHVE